MCSSIWSAETFPKGRLITYPASWGTRSRDMVASIEMPFEPIRGGSEGAMVGTKVCIGYRRTSNNDVLAYIGYLQHMILIG